MSPLSSSSPGLSAAQRRRALLAVTVANFAAMAGFGVFFPILPQYGFSIGADATDIGLAIAAFSLGQLIASPVVGRLSDRFGRKQVLLWSLALSALMHALNALCVTPFALIAVRFAGGLCAASFGVAFAVASDVSEPSRRTAAMGQVGAGLSLGFILGPALGGFIAGASAEPGDFALVCYAAAALSAMACIATWVLLPETGTRRLEATIVAPMVGLRLMRDVSVSRLVYLTLLSAAAVAMMEATFTLFASANLGAGPRTIGIVFAAMGVVTTILQLTAAGWASRRFGDERVMEAGILLQAVGLGILSVSAGLTLAAGGAMIIAMGFALLTPALASLTSLAADAAMQGEVLGIQQGGGSLGRVLGPGMSGPIYDGFGGNAPFFVGMAGMVATLVYARLTRRA